MHRRIAAATTALVVAVLVTGFHHGGAAAAPNDRFRTLDEAVAAGVVDPALVAELADGATTALVSVEDAGSLAGPQKGRAKRAEALADLNADTLASLDAALADPSATDLAHLAVRITKVRNERQLLALANRAVVTRIDADSQGTAAGVTTVQGEEGDP